MQVEPKRDVIEALLSFWNSTNNVLRFSNFEMTPTLEEIAGFTGFGVRLHHQRLIAPRGISINKFFQHLNICKVKEQSLDKGWISLQFLYDRGVQPYVPLRVLRQLGRCQVLPITKDMKDFVSEVGPEVPLPEGLAQKIWDGETHPEYSNWLKQQPRLQVRPERSMKEPIDHEAEMKIKIELAMQFEGERAKATQRETLLRGQVDLTTIRGTQVAELAVSRQQQLRTCDQKSQTDFDQEKAQWIRERGRLREEIESVSTQESRAREMVASRDQQIRRWNQTCNSLRSKVRRLADRTAQMGLDYREMNHEQFLAEVPEFAEYLMNSVQDIYQTVGGRVRPPSP
ncbi:hypothetical protein KY290_011049 [Solanum tuberosum]|uniref:Uncharacterized protein n=1 Tax=Solanum tuberosum TaxID=4113 RepID=A0ABQ7W238_SOLTU|nr:hypothetical protein KY290_011049 [Solanum tuberosum]